MRSGTRTRWAACNHYWRKWSLTLPERCRWCWVAGQGRKPAGARHLRYSVLVFSGILTPGVSICSNVGKGTASFRVSSETSGVIMPWCWDGPSSGGHGHCGDGTGDLRWARPGLPCAVSHNAVLMAVLMFILCWVASYWFRHSTVIPARRYYGKRTAGLGGKAVGMLDNAETDADS